MRPLALVISFFCLVLSVHAAVWSPYIGGSLQYDVAFAHYNMQSVVRSGTLHDFGCWGSQFEAGMASRDFSVYGAYHFSTSPIYAREYAIYVQGENLHQYRSLVEENSWKEQRGIVGMRWHPDGRRGRIRPLLGFALSYGRTHLTWHETTREYPSKEFISLEDVSRTSRYNLGTMIEFGMIIESGYNTAVTLLTQFHRFESDFGSVSGYLPTGRYVVIFPSVHLGVRYTMPFVHVGK